jgi:hypothetical protein
MTDNEIKDGLRCCASNELLNNTCDDCPYENKVFKYARYCNSVLSDDALDLINRQQAKIEALQMDNEQLQSDIINANMNLEHMTAEFEELEAEYEKVYEQAEADILGNLPQGGASCHWCIDKHKEYAIKEFAERLKEYLEITDCDDWFEITEHGLICEIDNLVKEMVGDAE